MYRIVLFVCLNMSYLLNAQYQEIKRFLPEEYSEGVILYRYNDSLFFVFYSVDYLNVADLDSAPKIFSDTNDISQYKRIIKTLEEAKDTQFSIMSELYYKGHIFFPNTFVLMELFRQHQVKIFMLKANEEVIELKYKFKKDKRAGTLLVLEAKTRCVLYYTSYKIIERK